jgi:hypothetical protein
MENIITLVSDVSLTLTLIVTAIFGIAELRASERERRERDPYQGEYFQWLSERSIILL